MSSQKRTEKQFYNSKWVNNLTNMVIPEFVKRTLSFGEKYNAPYFGNKKILIIDFIEEFESNNLKINSKIRNDIRADFTNEIIKFYKNKNHFPINDKIILNNYHKTKTFLKNNPNLFVTKADKGGAVVIMDKCDYVCKMNEILGDDGTDRKIKNDPLKKMTEKSNEFLKR